MSFIARLFYNNKDWQQPTNADTFSHNGNGYGVLVNHKKTTYRYGFEEWVFNPFIKKLRIGYLESYRSIRPIAAKVDKIMLVTRKDDGNFYHIGNILEVEQLRNSDIEDIKKSLIESNWKVNIQEHFSELGDNRSFEELIHYRQHWNDNSILKDRNDKLDTGFCFNIRYKKIELFKSNDYVNLTTLAGNEIRLTITIQHLGKRYSMQNLVNSLSNNNRLKKYLLTQIQ
jgi:hypothetical protein